MKAIRRSSLCAIAVFVPALAGCGGSPVRESTGEYFDDMIITTKVDTQLIGSGVNLAKIKVETFKGKVQLSGFAKSEQEKQSATQIAESVNGVKEVVNDVLIQ
jgi:hyperosmotically inducible periplasmic protein